MSEDMVWPSWPSEDKGNSILDIRVSKSIEELFMLMHGGFNEFRQRTVHECGYKGYTTTEWMRSLEDSSSEVPVSDITDLTPGLLVKANFQTAAVGKFYNTTEMRRIMSINPDSRIVLECFVATEAPYGSSFRTLVRHEFCKVGDSSSRLQISWTIVFLSRVNGFVKSMIEKGAKTGIQNSAQAAVSVLGSYATVEPFSVIKPTTVAKTPREASYGYRIIVDLCGQVFVDAMYPWASFLHASVAHFPVVQGYLTEDTSLIILTAIICLFALQVGLYIINAFVAGVQVQSSTGNGMANVIASLFSILFARLYIPCSVFEVASTFFIVYCIRIFAQAAVSFLPPPPSGSSVQTEAKPPPVDEAEMEEVESPSGTTFEGYQAAFKAASAAVSAANKVVSNRNPGKQTLQKVEEKSAAAIRDINRGVDALSSALAATSSSSKKPKQSAPVAGYTGPDLPPSILSYAVVEEVFENERYQPFRGWGHTWPGHFLPTDKTLRWSRRDATGADVQTGQVFEDVTPPLPQGWKWVEDCWRVDLSGVNAAAADSQGWAYGIDFNLVSFPSPPGAGRKRIADFVRRRRWLRTRVPDEEAKEEEERRGSEIEEEERVQEGEDTDRRGSEIEEEERVQEGEDTERMGSETEEEERVQQENSNPKENEYN